ncbi:MAG: glycosyltransferase [Deltaproteobacteria bacterium]|nr:glycosyltransferase [Deltaproteobacteria bacterium]
MGKETSVVICSYGGNEHLVKRCIYALEHQTRLPDEILLVVDTEQEMEMYTELLNGGVKVVYSGKKGLAAARNKGIEESEGEIVAFIDDDAVADENWLYEIVKSFSGSSDAAVVGGPVKPIFRGKKIKEKLNWIIGCTSNNPPTERPIGCNMAFDKRVFNTMGGFNENLGRVKEKLAIGEETELFLRIKKYMPDAKIVFNPDAIVYHEVPARRTKLGYMLRRAYEEGLAKAVIGKKYGLDTEQNYLKYYLKHLDFVTFMVLLSAVFGYIRGKLRR